MSGAWPAHQQLHLKIAIFTQMLTLFRIIIPPFAGIAAIYFGLGMHQVTSQPDEVPVSLINFILFASLIFWIPFQIPVYLILNKLSSVKKYPLLKGAGIFIFILIILSIIFGLLIQLKTVNSNLFRESLPFLYLQLIYWPANIVSDWLIRVLFVLIKRQTN